MNEQIHHLSKPTPVTSCKYHNHLSQIGFPSKAALHILRGGRDLESFTIELEPSSGIVIFQLLNSQLGRSSIIYKFKSS